MGKDVEIQKKTSKSARRPGSGLKRGLAATAGAGSDMSTVQLKWLHPSARYKIVDAHLCGCTYSLTILTYVSRKYIEASNMVSLSQSLFLSIMTDDFFCDFPRIDLAQKYPFARMDHQSPKGSGKQIIRTRKAGIA